MNLFLKITCVFFILSITSCSKKNLQTKENDLAFKREVNQIKNSFFIKELNKRNIKPSKLFIIEEITFPDTYTYLYDESSDKRLFIEGKVNSNKVNIKNVDLIKDKKYFLFDYYEEIIIFLKKSDIKGLKNVKNLHYSDDNYTYFEVIDFNNKSYIRDSVKYFGDNFEDQVMY
ncbi:hypothetical protein [Empedobacter brevis]|uniref:hypothetical protein n=1 Tax=Empedobacter brevis TaxID=247 RepID=UPI0028A09B14|nr:hypothetical protein [Empedobacter brevis]